MNLLLTLDHRFDRTPDGAVWTQTTFSYSFYQRYLAVFDHVQVIARIREVESVPSNWKRADGEAVAFSAVPYYVGPWQYLLKAQKVKQSITNAFKPGDAVILRVSSQIANHLHSLLCRYGYPYAVEVIGDPYDVFAPGAVKNPLRPFFRWWFPRQLQKQCIAACAAAYVTESALQKRYPPAKNAFSTHYSSVELPDEAFVTFPRLPRQDKIQFTIITVGTMDQLYKAPDVLIDAVAVCLKLGLNLELVLVGDGQHRAELEARAAKLGIKECVYFCGELLAGDAVRAELDRADLFVLPSHQEGLPRAMIEAMARGLPCIGSTVGGFPELLPDEDMVVPGNALVLADKICEVIEDPNRMAEMSARNLQKARNYREQLLQTRRTNLYRYLREKTENWMQVEGRSCFYKSQGSKLVETRLIASVFKSH
ncbi:glycosyltransferase family 4 protein [Calothrix membranacea FACHB-236]|nr:glycosyltransferase family 4 protein [Calothrix membranacea FACHB-236]